MRRSGRFPLILLLVLPLLVAHAQVSVLLHVPPRGQLNVERLWWVELNNWGDTLKGVWLHGEVHEATRGLVYSANTNEFDLPPGRTTVRYRDVRIRDQWRARGYEGFVTRTGRLPAGEYSFRVTLMPEDLGGDTVEFGVEDPTPPRLIAPRPGARLQQVPVFQWTAPRNHSGPVAYVLRVVEVLPGQNEEEALRSNRPVLERRGLRVTTFRYPSSGRRLEPLKRYAWQVVAELGPGLKPAASERWGFEKTGVRELVPQRMVRGPLTIHRDFERQNNWYQIKLRIENVGSAEIQDLVLTDSHRFFQCIDDADARRPPPPGSPLPGWMFEWQHVPSTVHAANAGYASVIEVDLSGQVLEPGRVVQVRYPVLPLLTFSLQGPGHTFGAGLKVAYKIGENQYQREFNGLALEPGGSLGQAWEASDYIISTSPAKLNAANPGAAADVDALLVTMARLARGKKGALMYLTGVPTTAATVRSVFKAFGTVLKNDWHQGYLLLVGEDEIVPCWDTVIPAPERPIPNPDHQYADLSGDAAPEVKVGRIIGTTAADLRIGIQHSLDAYYHTGGAKWSGATALVLTGLEQPAKGDNFTKEAGEGANYLRASKGVLATHWGMEYITTRRSVIDKALKHTKVVDGGAGTGANLGSFSTEQLAAWLLQITVGLPPPHSLDQGFTDTEGRARRVPFGFDQGDVQDASDEAEDIENARRGGWVNQLYGYPANVADSCEYQLRFLLPRYEALFFSAHGGSGGNSFNRLTTGVVNTIDFTSYGTRPAVVSFTCYVGNYGHQPGTIARALMRQGCAAHVGYSAMTNTGWFRSHVGSPYTFLQFWQKGKKIGDVLYDWKHHLNGDPGADVRLVPGYNLYGDPKFGGN